MSADGFSGIADTGWVADSQRSTASRLLVGGPFGDMPGPFVQAVVQAI
jgi:hypothetical protein